MILLELDPNIVKPGWTPFLITIGLAAVMYLLFRSMRRQFRRVDVNFGVPGDQSDAEADRGDTGRAQVPPADRLLDERPFDSRPTPG